MPYVGEIRLFAGNFGPAGWLLCQGQNLPIAENEVLFQLIGTTFGGDGESTFNIPDLQGRVPVHMGQGPGLSQNYVPGQSYGVESVTIDKQATPNHTHEFYAGTSLGTSANPEGNILHQGSDIRLYVREAPDAGLPVQMVMPVGGNQPHDNMPPVIAINYIISLYGVFPSPT